MFKIRQTEFFQIFSSTFRKNYGNQNFKKIAIKKVIKKHTNKTLRIQNENKKICKCNINSKYEFPYIIKSIIQK